MEQDDDIGICVDPPLVTRDQATELVAHYLMMAAAYFEAAPEGEATIAEIRRLVKGDERSVASVKAWLEAINQYYEDLKVDDL